MSSSIQAFLSMIEGIGGGCATIGRALAVRLNVPYHEDREGERLLGHRLKEVPLGVAIELLPSQRYRLSNGDVSQRYESGAEQLTEEVWTRDNWPTSYNDVPGAIRKLQHGIAGVYYHRPSMNLVLIDTMGEKVGIRSTKLTGPFGLQDEAILEGLKMLGRLKGPGTA
jgi:hypothetical protein